jgi:hypothetical protein
MIIMGTSAFPARNRARLRSPCAVPFHAQQHGDTGQAAAVQQVAHRDERQDPVHPYLPSDVDRQFWSRRVWLLGRLFGG